MKLDFEILGVVPLAPRGGALVGGINGWFPCRGIEVCFPCKGHQGVVPLYGASRGVTYHLALIGCMANSFAKYNLG